MKVFAGVLACVAAAVSVFAFVRSQGTSFCLVAPSLLLTFAFLVCPFPFFYPLSFSSRSANSSSSPQDLEPRVPGDVQRVPQVPELQPDRESMPKWLANACTNMVQSGISSEGYKGKGMVMCD